MKALILTDLHRGYTDNTPRIHDKAFAYINSNERFDMVLVSGDLGTSKLKDVSNCFKALRKAFPKIPILVVLGNHDLWDKTYRSLRQKIEKIKDFAEEFDIQLLENNPWENENLIIMGYDGWYKYDPIQSRDAEFMRHMFIEDTPQFHWLRQKADAAVNFILDYDRKNKKTIVMTHFPIIDELIDIPELSGNPMHGQVLLPISDVIIFGHSHLAVDEMIGKTRVINAGSDYNAVRYKVIEL